MSEVPPILRVRGLHVRYGHVHAVQGVDLDVREGAGVGIIGANGAGKSSTLKAIMGLADARFDELQVAGERVLRPTPEAMVRRGIGYVPEGRRIFPGLTVRQNLLMGAYAHPWDRRVRERVEEVYRLFPILARRDRALAGALSGGQQQMLAIGRALMGEPRLLVLDEPSMGLAPALVDEIVEAVRGLHARGLTLVLVEQNARLTFSLTEHCVVLESGRVVKEGPSRVLREDPEVRKIYLGV